ncbi:hypothetical protein CDL12_05893 [Handroanthus impetiginosus]|uniref:Transmembrane protein n=1 Tax=Handroanthus impetiginosus TaxID=429701 RepID=A0A2G9HVR5_9LAMI|nr:hypothetical protein CDL12_05893 [Handroanthus impetiginosus]
MNPRMKCSLLVFLLLSMFLYAGAFEFSSTGMNHFPLFHKVKVQEKSRKLLGLDAMLDYEDAGPNKNHDPRGKKGGGGSKSP